MATLQGQTNSISDRIYQSIMSVSPNRRPHTHRPVSASTQLSFPTSPRHSARSQVSQTSKQVVYSDYDIIKNRSWSASRVKSGHLGRAPKRVNAPAQQPSGLSALIDSRPLLSPGTAGSPGDSKGKQVGTRDLWNLRPGSQVDRLHQEWAAVEQCRAMKRASEMVQHRLDPMYRISGSNIPLLARYHVNDNELQRLREMTETSRVLQLDLKRINAMDQRPGEDSCPKPQPSASSLHRSFSFSGTSSTWWAGSLPDSQVTLDPPRPSPNYGSSGSKSNSEVWWGAEWTDVDTLSISSASNDDLMDVQAWQDRGEVGGWGQRLPQADRGIGIARRQETLGKLEGKHRAKKRRSKAEAESYYLARHSPHSSHHLRYERNKTQYLTDGRRASLYSGARVQHNWASSSNGRPVHVKEYYTLTTPHLHDHDDVDRVEAKRHQTQPETRLQQMTSQQGKQQQLASQPENTEPRTSGQQRKEDYVACPWMWQQHQPEPFDSWQDINPQQLHRLNHAETPDTCTHSTLQQPAEKEQSPTRTTHQERRHQVVTEPLKQKVGQKRGGQEKGKPSHTCQASKPRAGQGQGAGNRHKDHRSLTAYKQWQETKRLMTSSSSTGSGDSQDSGSSSSSDLGCSELSEKTGMFGKDSGKKSNRSDEQTGSQKTDWKRQSAGKTAKKKERTERDASEGEDTDESSSNNEDYIHSILMSDMFQRGGEEHNSDGDYLPCHLTFKKKGVLWFDKNAEANQAIWSNKFLESDHMKKMLQEGMKLTFDNCYKQYERHGSGTVRYLSGSYFHTVHTGKNSSLHGNRDTSMVIHMMKTFQLAKIPPKLRSARKSRRKKAAGKTPPESSWRDESEERRDGMNVYDWIDNNDFNLEASLVESSPQQAETVKERVPQTSPSQALSKDRTKKTATPSSQTATPSSPKISPAPFKASVSHSERRLCTLRRPRPNQRSDHKDWEKGRQDSVQQATRRTASLMSTQAVSKRRREHCRPYASTQKPVSSRAPSKKSDKTMTVSIKNLVIFDPMTLCNKLVVTGTKTPSIWRAQSAGPTFGGRESQTLQLTDLTAKKMSQVESSTSALIVHGSTVRPKSVAPSGSIPSRQRQMLVVMQGQQVRMTLRPSLSSPCLTHSSPDCPNPSLVTEGISNGWQEEGRAGVSPQDKENTDLAAADHQKHLSSASSRIHVDLRKIMVEWKGGRSVCGSDSGSQDGRGSRLETVISPQVLDISLDGSDHHHSGSVCGSDSGSQDGRGSGLEMVISPQVSDISLDGSDHHHSGLVCGSDSGSQDSRGSGLETVVSPQVLDISLDGSDHHHSGLVCGSDSGSQDSRGSGLETVVSPQVLDISLDGSDHHHSGLVCGSDSGSQDSRGSGLETVVSPQVSDISLDGSDHHHSGSPFPTHTPSLKPRATFSPNVVTLCSSPSRCVSLGVATGQPPPPSSLASATCSATALTHHHHPAVSHRCGHKEAMKRSHSMELHQHQLRHFQCMVNEDDAKSDREEMLRRQEIMRLRAAMTQMWVQEGGEMALNHLQACNPPHRPSPGDKPKQMSPAKSERPPDTDLTSGPNGDSSERGERGCGMDVTLVRNQKSRNSSQTAVGKLHVAKSAPQNSGHVDNTPSHHNDVQNISAGDRNQTAQENIRDSCSTREPTAHTKTAPGHRVVRAEEVNISNSSSGKKEEALASTNMPPSQRGPGDTCRDRFVTQATESGANKSDTEQGNAKVPGKVTGHPHEYKFLDHGLHSFSEAFKDQKQKFPFKEPGKAVGKYLTQPFRSKKACPPAQDRACPKTPTGVLLDRETEGMEAPMDEMWMVPPSVSPYPSMNGERDSRFTVPNNRAWGSQPPAWVWDKWGGSQTSLSAETSVRGIGTKPLPGQDSDCPLHTDRSLLSVAKPDPSEVWSHCYLILLKQAAAKTKLAGCTEGREDSDTEKRTPSSTVKRIPRSRAPPSSQPPDPTMVVNLPATTSEVFIMDENSCGQPQLQSAARKYLEGTRPDLVCKVTHSGMQLASADADQDTRDSDSETNRPAEPTAGQNDSEVTPHLQPQNDPVCGRWAKAPHHAASLKQDSAPAIPPLMFLRGLTARSVLNLDGDKQQDSLQLYQKSVTSASQDSPRGSETGTQEDNYSIVYISKSTLARRVVAKNTEESGSKQQSEPSLSPGIKTQMTVIPSPQDPCPQSPRHDSGPRRCQSADKCQVPTEKSTNIRRVHSAQTATEKSTAISRVHSACARISSQKQPRKSRRPPSKKKSSGNEKAEEKQKADKEADQEILVQRCVLFDRDSPALEPRTQAVSTSQDFATESSNQSPRPPPAPSQEQTPRGKPGSAKRHKKTTDMFGSADGYQDAVGPSTTKNKNKKISASADRKKRTESGREKKSVKMDIKIDTEGAETANTKKKHSRRKEKGKKKGEAQAGAAKGRRKKKQTSEVLEICLSPKDSSGTKSVTPGISEKDQTVCFQPDDLLSLGGWSTATSICHPELEQVHTLNQKPLKKGKKQRKTAMDKQDSSATHDPATNQPAEDISRDMSPYRTPLHPSPPCTTDLAEESGLYSWDVEIEEEPQKTVMLDNQSGQPGEETPEDLTPRWRPTGVRGRPDGTEQPDSQTAGFRQGQKASPRQGLASRPQKYPADHADRSRNDHQSGDKYSVALSEASSQSTGDQDGEWGQVTRRQSAPHPSPSDVSSLLARPAPWGISDYMCQQPLRRPLRMMGTLLRDPFSIVSKTVRKLMASPPQDRLYGAGVDAGRTGGQEYYRDSPSDMWKTCSDRTLPSNSNRGSTSTSPKASCLQQKWKQGKVTSDGLTEARHSFLTLPAVQKKLARSVRWSTPGNVGCADHSAVRLTTKTNMAGSVCCPQVMENSLNVKGRSREPRQQADRGGVPEQRERGWGTPTEAGGEGSSSSRQEKKAGSKDFLLLQLTEQREDDDPKSASQDPHTSVVNLALDIPADRAGGLDITIQTGDQQHQPAPGGLNKPAFSQSPHSVRAQSMLDPCSVMLDPCSVTMVQGERRGTTSSRVLGLSHRQRRLLNEDLCVDDREMLDLHRGVITHCFNMTECWPPQNNKHNPLHDTDPGLQQETSESKPPRSRKESSHVPNLPSVSDGEKSSMRNMAHIHRAVPSQQVSPDRGGQYGKDRDSALTRHTAQPDPSPPQWTALLPQLTSTHLTNPPDNTPSAAGVPDLLAQGTTLHRAAEHVWTVWPWESPQASAGSPEGQGRRSWSRVHQRAPAMSQREVPMTVTEDALRRSVRLQFQDSTHTQAPRRAAAGNVHPPQGYTSTAKGNTRVQKLQSMRPRKYPQGYHSPRREKTHLSKSHVKLDPGSSQPGESREGEKGQDGRGQIDVLTSPLSQHPPAVGDPHPTSPVSTPEDTPRFPGAEGQEESTEQGEASYTENSHHVS